MSNTPPTVKKHSGCRLLSGATIGALLGFVIALGCGLLLMVSAKEPPPWKNPGEAILACGIIMLFFGTIGAAIGLAFGFGVDGIIYLVVLITEAMTPPSDSDPSEGGSTGGGN